jgi:hypothetical protein
VASQERPLGRLELVVAFQEPLEGVADPDGAAVLEEEEEEGR